MNEKLYAAITGDVIRSTKLKAAELDAIKRKVEKAAKTIGEWKKGLVDGSPDFHRGDAWQLLLTDPAFSLRASIFIRASLLSMEMQTESKRRRRADTRLAVGIGTVERVSTKRISDSVGEAFVLSGRTFDRLKTHCNMSISASDSLELDTEWLPVFWHLIDALVERWTLKQAEIICLAIAPQKPTQGEIGAKFKPPKDQQTISRSLSGAGWHAVLEALERFESLSWKVGRK